MSEAVGTLTPEKVKELVLEVVKKEFGYGGENLDLSIVRSIAYNTAKELIYDNRRRVLEGMGMALLEGKMDIIEDGRGGKVVKVDRTSLDEILGHYFDTGDRVRVLVQLIDEEEQMEEGGREDCVACGEKKENRRVPYCRSCWKSE